MVKLKAPKDSLGLWIMGKMYRVENGCVSLPEEGKHLALAHGFTELPERVEPRKYPRDDAA